MLTKLFQKFFSKKNSAFAQSDVVRTAAVRSSARQFNLDSLEDRKLMASNLALGMNINNLNSSTYSSIVSMLRETGQKSVRLWYGFSSYGDRSTNGVLKFAPRFKADGFDVMVAVVPSGGKVGSASQVQGLFEFLMNAPGLRGAVDRWQVGNEPDHDNFWNGSPTSYVSQYLKPAAEVIHRYGEKVVSAGPSWNPEDVRDMVKAGMLSYADFVGYHPYRNSLSDLKAKVAEVKSIVGGKPLVASEWNVRGHEGDANLNAWAEDIGDYFDVIGQNFYAAYFYAAYCSSTKAGRGGVLRTSGAHNDPVYTAVKNYSRTFSGGTPVEPPSTPTTPTDPGSTPSNTTTAPKITGFTLINSSTGKAISGYSNITSSKTISLSSLPTRNIQIVAIANSTTGSVKVGFTGRASHTENNAAYELIVDSKGNATSWYATAGSYTASATAYAKDNLAGTKGNTLSITLKFV